MGTQTMNLPVRLTEAELVMKRDELVRVIQQRADVDQEKRDSAAAFAKQLKRLDQEIFRLTRQISERQETRLVEVWTRKNIAERLVEFIRCDTGEMVDTRPMESREAQVDLEDVVRDVAGAPGVGISVSAGPEPDGPSAEDQHLAGGSEDLPGGEDAGDGDPQPHQDGGLDDEDGVE